MTEGMIMMSQGRSAVVRELPPYERVELRPGQRVKLRMPTVQERAELEIGEGVPVFEVHGPQAGEPALYVGDRTMLIAPTDGSAASRSHGSRPAAPGRAAR